VFDTSSSRTTVVVGRGELAADTGAGDRQETLTMVAEVDTRTHKIIDVSVTAASAISQRWLKDLIVGRDLTSEGDTLRLKFALDKFFVDPSREAVHSAYLDVTVRYASHVGIIQRPQPVPEGEPT
jgi:hypothetical protein